MNILSYAEICNKVINDIDRNSLIVENIKSSFENQKNILVLTDRIEHTKILEEKIKSFTDKVFVITGQMSSNAKMRLINRLV